MYRIQLILLAALLLTGGTASADKVITVNKTQQKQNAGSPKSSPEYGKNDAQTQIEQAAEHFDAFALQMPNVINAKLDAFMKHGFRSFLLNDPETKPVEEKMIDSLVKGLQAMGNSLSEDLSKQNVKATEEHSVKKLPQSP